MRARRFIKLNLDLYLPREDFTARAAVPEFPLTFQYELNSFLKVFLDFFNSLTLAESPGNGIHPADVPFIALFNSGFKGLFHTPPSLDTSIQQPGG